MPGRPLLFVASSMIVGIVAVGCGDDGVQSDAERFCGEAKAQRETILNPPMSSQAELDASLEFFRLMGELAPLAIAEQWNDLVAAIETASTVVPGNPDSEQQAAITAYATERSAFEVATYLRRVCGVEIPITTIAPQESMPARTTSTTSLPPDPNAVPPSSTTAP